jgi:hypothetical protein
MTGARTIARQGLVCAAKTKAGTHIVSTTNQVNAMSFLMTASPCSSMGGGYSSDLFRSRMDFRPAIRWN